MKWFVSLLFGSLILSSCVQSEYEKLVKRELAKNVRYDSLVFGMQFGDTKKEFFVSCWELNKQGLVWQSENNDYVKHVLKAADSTQSDINMLFYGDFDDDEIMVRMRMKFSYTAWAPWNKQLYSDQLVMAVRDSIESWYPGNQFIKMEYDQEPKEIWVKVDGNRRIAMTISGERDVVAKIDDLSHQLSEGENFSGI